MKIDVGKIFEISARVSFALLVASMLVLFFPASLLPFEIIPFREKHGFWIFLAFVISIAMLISYLAKWGIKIISGKIERYKTFQSYKYVLKNMSLDERKYLKALYDTRQTAIMLDLSNPVVKKLETFKVLSMSAGTCMAPRGMVPGFVQPWVFELLDKHPEYIKIEEDAANA